MNSLTIIEKIQSGEDAHTEFKTSFGTGVIESLVAFANCHGGTVYIGINDSCAIKGVAIGSESVQQWINEIKNKTRPELLPDVEIHEIEGKTIVSFHQHEYPIKPVGYQGRYFKRIKNSNHQMTVSEVSDMHLRSINSSWDSHIDPAHSLSDISDEKVQKVIQALIKKGRAIDENSLAFFQKYSLLRENKLTFGAYLLFKNEDCLLSTIELGRFQDDITIKDSDRTKSDLLSQVDQVIHFVKKHINKAVVISENPQSEENGIIRWKLYVKL